MADPWIRVHAQLYQKPVIGRAATALHVSRHEAIGVLAVFWGAVSQLSVNGEVGQYTDEQIEAMAMWTRRRGKFAAFIRANHLDAAGRINEWDDYAGALELRRATERNRLRNKRERLRQQLHDVEQQLTNSTQDVAQQPANSTQDVAQQLGNVGQLLQDVGTRARVTKRDETITTRATTSTARANGSAGLAGLAERLSEVDRAALGELLGVVPSPTTWIADLTASLDGMPGHIQATPEQLGEAIRDYLGNGASTNPNLRQMRRYIESTVHPIHAWPLGSTKSIAPAPKGGGARSDASIDAAVARLKEAQDGKP